MLSQRDGGDAGAYDWSDARLHSDPPSAASPLSPAVRSVRDETAGSASRTTPSTVHCDRPSSRQMGAPLLSLSKTRQAKIPVCFIRR